MGPQPVYPYLMRSSINLGEGGRSLQLPPSVTRRDRVHSLGIWNVRGINRVEKVEDIFGKGKFELLALSETKLEGNGDGITTGIQEIEMDREGMPILMNDMCRGAVVDLDLLAQEPYGLHSSFQGLKYVRPH